MTPEELEQYIAKADNKGFVEAAAGLPESERKKLSKTAIQIWREIDRQHAEYDSNAHRFLYEPIQRMVKWLKGETQHDYREQKQTALLAVFAMCPLSVTRKINEFFNNEIRDLFVKIIFDRKPEWLDDWIEERLKGNWPRVEWDALRRFMKGGICRKPTSDRYLQLMVSSFPDSWHKKDGYTPLSEKLLKEPDLLEEIWRLFEVETIAFTVSYDSFKDLPPGFETWMKAISVLSERGYLDRQRLLDGCLSGLTTGFKNNTLSGYIQLYNQLKPSIDEIRSRQQRYIDLLSHSAAHVVTFALKNLEHLDKNRSLADESCMQALVSVFRIGTKIQPASALKILQHIVSRKPDLTNAAARIATEGLTHPLTEIQGKALDLLETWLPRCDEEIYVILRSHIDEIASSHRTRLEHLCGSHHEDFGEPVKNIDDAGIGKFRAQAEERINQLPKNLRQLAEVDRAMCVFEGESPPPLEYSIHEIPLLTGLEAIRPFESIQELIDAVSHTVETVDSADEVERILDGISRFCDQEMEGFYSYTEPVVKRILERGGTSKGFLVPGSGWPPSFAAMILVWLRSEYSSRIYEAQFELSGPILFLDGRVTELGMRVNKKQAAPLLAAPTHQHGWLDPRKLVQRMKVWQSQKTVIQDNDFKQAMLRLAPDFRREACEEAKQLTGDTGRIVRYALGGDEKPERRDGYQAFLWLAAGRARCPRERLDDLECLDLERCGPDELTAANYTWKAYTSSRKTSWDNSIYTIPRLELSTGKSAEDPMAQLKNPTTALHTRDRWTAYSAHSSQLIQWIGMTWP